MSSTAEEGCTGHGGTPGPEVHAQRILQTLGDGLVVQDHRERLLYWNPAAARILGLPDEVTPGHPGPDWQALHEDGTEWSPAAVPSRLTLESGDPVAGAVMGLRGPDGGVKWLEVSTRALEDDRGRQVVSTFSDITDHVATKHTLEATERELSANFDGSPSAMSVTTVDGVFLRVNAAYADLLGVPADTLPGTRWFDHAHPGDLPEAHRAVESLLRGRSETAVVERRLLRADGTEAVVMVHVRPVRDDGGEVTRLINTVLDVTERRRIADALRLSEARFRLLAESAPIGIFSTDPTGACTYTNPRFRQIFGLSAPDAAGHGWLDALHPDERDEVVARWTAAAGRGADYEAEHRVRTPAGDVRHVRIMAAPVTDGGALAGHIGSVEDVTQRHLAQARLAELARSDPLTSLLNRREFEQVLARHLAGDGRDRGALILIDLDNFKDVNDRFGHGVGDDVLIGVAHELRRRLRSGDHVARLGGDEFAVLIPTGGRIEAELVAQAILEATVEATRSLSGGTEVTASVGVVVLDGTVQDRRTALDRADAAMYRAKRSGRNAWALDDPDTDEPDPDGTADATTGKPPS